MTRAQVARILKQVRYKPGWKIRLDAGLYGALDVEVTANVQDAYHPSRKPIDPPHAYVTDAHLLTSTRDLVNLIFDACKRLEVHECTEWFKYRGRRPFDQHR